MLRRRGGREDSTQLPDVMSTLRKPSEESRSMLMGFQKSEHMEFSPKALKALSLVKPEELSEHLDGARGLENYRLFTRFRMFRPKVFWEFEHSIILAHKEVRELAKSFGGDWTTATRALTGLRWVGAMKDPETLKAGCRALKAVVDAAGENRGRVVNYGLPIGLRKGVMHNLDDIERMARLFNPGDAAEESRTVACDMMSHKGAGDRVVGAALLGAAASAIGDSAEALDYVGVLAPHLGMRHGDVSATAGRSIRRILTLQGGLDSDGLAALLGKADELLGKKSIRDKTAGHILLLYLAEDEGNRRLVVEHALSKADELLSKGDSDSRMAGAELAGEFSPRLGDKERAFDYAMKLTDYLEVGFFKMVNQGNVSLIRNAAKNIAHIVVEFGMDIRSPEGGRLRSRVEPLIYSREPTVRIAAKKVMSALSEGTNRIPHTVLSKATLDDELTQRYNLGPDGLSDAIASGIILGDESGEYTIPLRDPRVVQETDDAHGRSVHTSTYPTYCLKGVGRGRFTTVATAYKRIHGPAATPTHRFSGGEQASYIGGQFGEAVELRGAYTELCESDAAIRLAMEYGVTVDLFVEPLAVFKPKEIPVRKRGKPLPSVAMVEHGAGMRMAGVPSDIAQEHRVYLYRALVPERLQELPNINEDGAAWGRIVKAVEAMPGDKLKGLPVELKIAFRAAAGYATLNHIVHHIWDGACSTQSGSVFQPGEHNLNPLCVFDYDTVWKGEREGILRGRGILRSRASKRTYQDDDYEDAQRRLRSLCRRLNLNDEQTDQAVGVYQHVYNA